MKTTFDLPAELVKELKLRAVHEGRNLKEVAAEMLRKGLDADASPPAQPAFVIRKHKQSGFPYLEFPGGKPAANPLTPEEIAQILIDQEAEWYGK